MYGIYIIINTPKELNTMQCPSQFKKKKNRSESMAILIPTKDLLRGNVNSILEN